MPWLLTSATLAPIDVSPPPRPSGASLRPPPSVRAWAPSPPPPPRVCPPCSRSLSPPDPVDARDIFGAPGYQHPAISSRLLPASHPRPATSHVPAPSAHLASSYGAIRLARGAPGTPSHSSVETASHVFDRATESPVLPRTLFRAATSHRDHSENGSFDRNTALSKQLLPSSDTESGATHCFVARASIDLSAIRRLNESGLCLITCPFLCPYDTRPSCHFSRVSIFDHWLPHHRGSINSPLRVSASRDPHPRDRCTSPAAGTTAPALDKVPILAHKLYRN